MLKARSPFRALAKHRAISPPPPSRQGRLFPPCRGNPVISSFALSGRLLRRPVELGRLRHDSGVLVPLDIEPIEYAIADTQLLRKGQEEAINDRRLAESIYRAAVASGIMERVAYQDTIAEAG